jgi:hypothetical protein
LILRPSWANISQIITESKHNAFGNCSNSVKKNILRITMVPWQALGSSSVQHVLHHPKDEGLSPAAISGIGKEKMAKGAAIVKKYARYNWSLITLATI